MVAHGARAVDSPPSRLNHLQELLWVQQLNTRIKEIEKRLATEQYQHRLPCLVWIKICTTHFSYLSLLA